mgnify:CR=1 FL=1
MGNIIEVKNLNKSFGKKKVLNNVSLSVSEGEIVGFIGPNGAGKTTTIKLILGLQKIDSGTVVINGYDIVKDFKKAIEKVGAIVESPDLYMYLSGLDNLKMIASMYNGIDSKRIDEIVKLVGLENRIKDKVSKYSLGMRQRLGIAASLIHSPNVLILDEPTNGLDPEGIKELRALLKKLAKKEKMGVLISSHNLSELESFCTDVCLIKNGEILTTASIEEIRKADKSSYLFKLDKTTGLEDLLSKDDKVINDTLVKMFIDEEDVPDMMLKLFKEGYKIYEVKRDTLTLEEAFISKTGGNIID